MQKTDPLIRTKLRLPFFRPGLVFRPRLQTRIVEGLLNPLTLVIAPAGFGKTTLVAESLTHCRMPVAWLSLDRGDNQVGRFLTYLIAALRSADDQICLEASQLMAGMHQALPEAVMISIINDLDAASAEMVLVLDDYQFIASAEVHAAVAFLLDHFPQNFHLLIATRSDPALPLARLRARGQMIELRAADLRFTFSEAAQFLNDVMGLHLDGGSVSVLEQRTEGWVAGLQMAALSMQDREDVNSFIERFSGTNRHILDYLLEEILTSQSQEIQQFLLCTSILERLSAPLCDSLFTEDQHPEIGGENGKSHFELTALRLSDSFLKYLERENLFLVSLDDERIWFRYHQLFTDLLRARLHQTQPDLIPLLHIRASAWLEQQGFILEAIQHLLAAHENDRAADLIERYGPEFWAESDPSIVQMADSLPFEMLISRPKIGLYQVWLLILQGLIEKALPLLNGLAQQPAVADPNNRQQWMQTIIGLVLAFLGLRPTTPGFDPLPDSRVLDEIPSEELILREAANILYAMTLGRLQEIDRAEEFSIQCIQREKTPRETLAIPNLVPFLARLYLLQGRLQKAVSLCRQFLDPITEKGIRFIYSAGSMNIVLGEVLHEQNCLQEAEKQIRDGLLANEPWVDIMTEAFGLLALTHVLCAQKEYPGAMQIVEKFEARLRGNLRPSEFQEDFHTLGVRVLLSSGDVQKASDWADQIHHSEDFQLHNERYRLTLARIRLAQGRYADVEKLLTWIDPLTAAGNRITRKLESDLLLAAAISGQNRLSEARDIIESALALAEPEGYIRVFLDVGDPIRELLAAYIRSEAPGHKLFAQKVLDAFSPPSKAGSPGTQSAGLIEPLSDRELEVLCLIALGKTNQEIAQQLVVARGTIKAHAASIFRKLEVTNRTEAVARARQLGILH